MDNSQLKREILSLFVNPDRFDEVAQMVFKYQLQNNLLFRRFNNAFSTPSKLRFLPISFFKNHVIKSGDWTATKIFESSGTSQSATSQHHIRDLDWMHEVFARIFRYQFGDIKARPILALLPSYLERQNSSLVEMVRHFMQLSEHPENGFYLDDFQALADKLDIHTKKKGILIGVSFAMLDFAISHKINLKNWDVFETGGMKGRKEEMPREQLHDILSTAFNRQEIGSEYGMTELTGQFYSNGKGIFDMNPLCRIQIRAIDDPEQILPTGRVGRIHVIDLGNIDTCSFIATDDIGKKMYENQFSIEGRVDHSDMRGCNLLYH